MKLLTFLYLLFAVAGWTAAFPVESTELATVDNSAVVDDAAKKPPPKPKQPAGKPAKGSISGFPSKSIQCGGKNPRAATYSVSDIKKAAEAELDHILSNTKAGNSGQPKKYGYKDKDVHFSNAACKKGDDLYEFPITRGVFTGNQDIKNIADRVIIKKNGKKATYCGLITHLDAPGNDFKSCSG